MITTKEEEEEVLVVSCHLASKRAEREGIKEGAVADEAGVGDTFTRPWLWPLVQEHYPSTIYYVCLNPCYVHIFLNLRHPYHIVVGRPPYLTLTTSAA